MLVHRDNHVHVSTPLTSPSLDLLHRSVTAHSWVLSNHPLDDVLRPDSRRHKGVNLWVVVDHSLGVARLNASRLCVKLGLRLFLPENLFLLLANVPCIWVDLTYHRSRAWSTWRGRCRRDWPYGSRTTVVRDAHVPLLRINTASVWCDDRRHVGDLLLCLCLRFWSGIGIGESMTLPVIIAVLLGGIDFGGGAGRIPGVIVGVFFMGVLEAGLLILGVTEFVQQVIVGAVLIAAIYTSTLRRRRLRPS